jgi:hypothetical protein
MMKTPQREIKTFDHLVKWCEMPKEELQNRIALYFKRVADFTDYVDHNQYFNPLINAKYILFNAVAILMTSFLCDDQAVDMVYCTVSPRWRKHMPPRNDTVLLRMGTRLDTHFKVTTRSIPAALKWRFINKNV